MVAGCNTRPANQNDDGTCDPLEPSCEAGLVCALFDDGMHRCATTVVLRGVVVSIVDDMPIADALVQAIDVNGAPVGAAVRTDESGAFELAVPAGRDEMGVPIEGSYTLRAQAAGYQSFPTALRPALPIDAGAAVLSEEGESSYVIESSLTTIKLIALPGDSSQLATISGHVETGTELGVLVIAEGVDATYSGLADGEGAYTIFNVPAGTYTVRGYARGAQIDQVMVSVESGELREGVELVTLDRPLNSVTGSIEIVDAPGDAVTSVVLAVESTFNEVAARGEVPPGLRVGDVTGAFTITDVPDGRYVVLAAFENDQLVRDPDQSIAGTAVVPIELPDPDLGSTVQISEGFKVTGALEVVSPGADGPEQVDTLTPILEWADDASEDGYEIEVFDAFGQRVWSTEIPGVSGSATVTLGYAGPALQPGMFYQFKVESFRDRTGGRTAISATEDLKGVFFFLEQP